MTTAPTVNHVQISLRNLASRRSMLSSCSVPMAATAATVASPRRPDSGGNHTALALNQLNRKCVPELSQIVSIMIPWVPWTFSSMLGRLAEELLPGTQQPRTRGDTGTRGNDCTLAILSLIPIM